MIASKAELSGNAYLGKHYKERITDATSAHLNTSLEQGGASPVNILNGVNATPRKFGEYFDTSSHVAVIKMLMMTFGPRPADLFDQVRPVAGGYDVRFKDGYSLHVSHTQLRQVSGASRFVGNDSAVIQDANFALAVFIRRKQLSVGDHTTDKSFEAVLASSLRGETVFNLLKGLGMAGFIRQVPTQQVVRSGAAAVMQTHSFGAALVHGAMADVYGRKEPPDQPYVYVLAHDRVPVKTPAAVSTVATLPDPVPPVTAAPAAIVTAFTAVERRFGESFDVSSHAAVIKMMMVRFGPNPADMFEKVQPTGDGYAVTMKDGFELSLSGQELKQVEQASRFVGADPGAVRSANFMLAAYTKRKQSIGSQRAHNQTFDAVLSDTLRGATTYNILKGMGMVGFLRIVPPGKMQEPGAVAVAHTYNFSGALVLDGVKHEYGNQVPVVKDYGYMLAHDVPGAPPVDVGRALPALSSVAVGVKPANIWSGFYQAAPRNCVTVSAIKAAMMKYGQSPLGICRNIVETRDGYTVTLRDNCTVHLTHEELKQAQQAASFLGDDPGMLKDAVFLYAVSAKRAQMENHEFRAGASYEAALGTLNDGEIPGDALRRLGLYAFTRASSVEALLKGATGTLSNFEHSVVVVDGQFDDYGYRVKLEGSQWARADGQALVLV